MRLVQVKWIMRNKITYLMHQDNSHKMINFAIPRRSVLARPYLCASAILVVKRGLHAHAQEVGCRPIIIMMRMVKTNIEFHWWECANTQTTQTGTTTIYRGFRINLTDCVGQYFHALGEVDKPRLWENNLGLCVNLSTLVCTSMKNLAQ